MSRLLATFPGRAGDLLWALPSIRALSEAHGEPVDLATTGEFQSLVPLLRQQEYLDKVWAWDEWGLTPPKEWCPPLQIAERIKHEYQQVWHLGYRGWPDKALPHYTFALAQSLSQVELRLDLARPWIQVGALAPSTTYPLIIGFTEAWFELKLGLLVAISGQHRGIQLTPHGSRWTTEAPGQSVLDCDWITAARAIRDCRMFLGDCSALHVLAVALGKPCVVVEPMEARWNPVFYPFGMDSRVKVVKGHDARPTFDARAVAQALEEALRCA